MIDILKPALAALIAFTTMLWLATFISSAWDNDRDNFCEYKPESYVGVVAKYYSYIPRKAGCWFFKERKF